MGVAGYFGNLPLSKPMALQGVFSNRTKCRLTEITDGTSQVLLFGEVTGGRQPGLLRCYTWIASDSMITYFGLDPDATSAFASEHLSSVQFAFVDGSVHRVSLQIDLDSLYARSGKHDGGRPNWDAVK
jgi:hypothetical protein